MKLLTQEQFDKLIDNGCRQQPVKGTEHEIDFCPVVRLFHPAAAATWLLTEIEPEDNDIAWGLCDLGMRCPEFGTVSLSELAGLRGPFGLGVERDRHWDARGPISAYIAAAIAAGRIVELPAPSSATS